MKWYWFALLLFIHLHYFFFSFLFLELYPLVCSFFLIGWASYWRAQCHRGSRICTRFDVSTWSNQSRKFSTFSVADWLEPWSRYCRCYRCSKAPVRILLKKNYKKTFKLRYQIGVEHWVRLKQSLGLNQFSHYQNISCFDFLYFIYEWDVE